MDNISLFTRYSTTENRITNYCMLFLRLMTAESTYFLQEVFRKILPLDKVPHFGVKFSQQQKNEAGSIPDGLIIQKEVCIHFEFKTSDWFHMDQIQAHAEGLMKQSAHAEKALVLITSSFKVNTLKSIATLQHEFSFPIVAITFYDLLMAIQSVDDLSKGLKEHLNEFRTFLEDEGLLNKGLLVPHHLMLGVKLAQSYKDASHDPSTLYEFTRKAWKLNKAKLASIEYVLSVYHGIVREIYKPTAWHQQDDGRMFFDGTVENDPSIRSAYLYKEVQSSGQNPTFYLLPSTELN